MFVDSREVIPDFDPHFKIFHDLMSFKVQEILLISSLYDAFIMEEDGSLATRLINEYHGLNLSKPPKITRASSAEEAFDLISKRSFDMVITMPFLGGMDAFELGRRIKKIEPELPVILVAHNMKSTFPDKKSSYGVDQVFLWCCEADLLLAMIKNVEDHRNVDNDIRNAMVRVIIYVEDSPLYRSLFLPMIYNEVVWQTQAVLDDSLNERHRLLRMRARPKILIATNYEEALKLFKAYKPHVFGIISDARYRKGGEIDGGAGEAFLKYVRNEVEELPLLMVSAEEQNREVAKQIPAVFIDKNSPAIQCELHNFFLNNLGFGDFIFRMPDETPIIRASNMLQFENALKTVPAESISYHAGRNHFSNWVMARAEVILARKIHKDFVRQFEDIEDVRQDLINKVHSTRKLKQQGVVVKFSDDYDPDVMDFVKIGKGPLGGKARGIAFMWSCLQGVKKSSLLDTYRVTIPKTCVITADGFDSFVEENRLHYCKHYPDEQLSDLFLDAPLPAWLRKELYCFLQKTCTPLSVRSSSLLEDGHLKPYAGLYSTYFLANNHPDFEERFAQLESAVKLVYASTWYEGPIAFSKIAGYGREDSMAVLIQELAGERYGDFWYPGVSGVAQSRNFYPVMGMKPEEGIAHIALGVGKTVVEGGKTLWFSPAKPKKLVQFSSVDSILQYSQRQFYALDVAPENCLDRDVSNLVLRNIQDAEDESPVKQLCSTYVPAEHRIRDMAIPGPKILTFAQLLKYSSYPLADIIGALLDIGKVGMGGEVEMEFALNLDPQLEKSTFYFLQIRPMVTGGELADVEIFDHEFENCFCYSGNALGHGANDKLRDIIYVDPGSFDLGKTAQIAREIGELNRKLTAEDVPFALIGPGRWGSADHSLGIPVSWADISGVAVIVELRNDAIRVDASQGTHFFQNITSLGIPYLTLDENGSRDGHRDAGRRPGGDYIDWQWLAAQELLFRGDFIRHVRTREPFIFKCDGINSESVMVGAAGDSGMYGINGNGV
ncbi:MAG: phosphoenolpyruvate synthase/pyruvate phosphate dikinase [Desulfobacterales bacterium]|nr:MAG: phosphoenolpyruvate synthase/pyruvate phosphate dikinase [Desulfobacterales bacterium]